MEFVNRFTKWLEVLLWLVLIGLATVYCWERSLYQDSAYALFKVLNMQNTMEHGRFLVPVSIIPAYLFSNFGLPINLVVWSFSISGIFFAGVLSYYFNKVAKQSVWPWIPPLLVLISGPEFFFLGISEMIPALLLCSLFAYAFWQQKYWAALPMALAIFAHPGILPALFFVIALRLISDFKSVFGYIHLALLLTFILLKTKFIENSTYESGIFDQITIQNTKTLFSSWGWDFFIHSLGSWMLPVSIIVLIYILLSPIHLKSILSFFLFAVLTLFIVFVFQTGDSLMMMQKSYAPIVLMSMLLFIYQLPFFKKKIPWNYMFILFAFWGGILISKEGQFYRNRMKKIDQLISIAKPGKYFISKDYFDPEKFRVSWAIPYETLIRSSSKFGNEKCRTFCLSKPEDIIPSANETKDQFRGAEFAYPLPTTSLRKGYFDFDSKVGYLQFNP